MPDGDAAIRVVDGEAGRGLQRTAVQREVRRVERAGIHSEAILGVDAEDPGVDCGGAGVGVVAAERHQAGPVFDQRAVEQFRRHEQIGRRRAVGDGERARSLQIHAAGTDRRLQSTRVDGHVGVEQPVAEAPFARRATRSERAARHRQRLEIMGIVGGVRGRKRRPFADEDVLVEAEDVERPPTVRIVPSITFSVCPAKLLPAVKSSVPVPVLKNAPAVAVMGWLMVSVVPDAVCTVPPAAPVVIVCGPSSIVNVAVVRKMPPLIVTPPPKPRFVSSLMLSVPALIVCRAVGVVAGERHHARPFLNQVAVEQLRRDDRSVAAAPSATVKVRVPCRLMRVAVMFDSALAFVVTLPLNRKLPKPPSLTALEVNVPPVSDTLPMLCALLAVFAADNVAPVPITMLGLPPSTLNPVPTIRIVPSTTFSDWPVKLLPTVKSSVPVPVLKNDPAVAEWLAHGQCGGGSSFDRAPQRADRDRVRTVVDRERRSRAENAAVDRHAAAGSEIRFVADAQDAGVDRRRAVGVIPSEPLRPPSSPGCR